MNTIRDTTTERSWFSPRELIDHIVATHHSYLRLSLQRLNWLIARLAQERLVPLSLMDRLQREFTALADLLETHLARQECRLFPKIRQLREPVGEIAWACRLGDSIEELMERSIREGEDALALAEQIEACLSDARWGGKGPLGDELIEGMHELHEDIANHFRLETDLLFPRVRELLQEQWLAV